MTAEQVNEVPDPARPGHWVLPHWTGPGLLAGVAGPPHDLRLRHRPADQVARAWTALMTDLTGARALLVAPQVHGATVHVHAQGLGWGVTADGDGHLTQAPGVAVAVTVADCVPIYLRHDATGWVGVLHAGWRGVAGGLLPAALARLAAIGVPSHDVVIHCGVSICGTCYEVGHEVYEAVTGVASPVPHRLDLRQHLAQQAEEAGAERITVSGWCTAEHGFHSHRGAAGSPERMAAYILTRLP